MDINEKIKQLVHLWYRIVCCDHHKDRDCHWYIEHKYSYDGQESWAVSHNGYIRDEIVRKAKDLDHALLILYQELMSACKEEIDHAVKWKDEPEMDFNYAGIASLEPAFKEIVSG